MCRKWRSNFESQTKRFSFKKCVILSFRRITASQTNRFSLVGKISRRTQQASENKYLSSDTVLLREVYPGRAAASCAVGRVCFRSTCCLEDALAIENRSKRMRDNNKRTTPVVCGTRPQPALEELG